MKKKEHIIAGATIVGGILLLYWLHKRKHPATVGIPAGDPATLGTALPAQQDQSQSYPNPGPASVGAVDLGGSPFYLTVNNSGNVPKPVFGVTPPSPIFGVPSKPVALDTSCGCPDGGDDCGSGSGTGFQQNALTTKVNIPAANIASQLANLQSIFF